MKLKQLVHWLQSGNGVRGIPETDIANCPRGLLINITDLNDVQALKTSLKLMPTFADCEVVKIGIPKPPPVEKPKPKKKKKTIAEATAPKSEKSEKKDAE